jgi:hypothetical protein
LLWENNNPYWKQTQNAEPDAKSPQNFIVILLTPVFVLIFPRGKTYLDLTFCNLMDFRFVVLILDEILPYASEF